MRVVVAAIALLMGMIAVQDCQAQLLGSTGTGATRTGTANMRGTVAPSTMLGSGFRLRDLFPSFRGSVTNRNPVGYSVIPDPNTPEYFKAFGYKKLF